MTAALPYLVRSVRWAPVCVLATAAVVIAVIDRLLATTNLGGILVVATAAMLSAACVVAWDPAEEHLRALPVTTTLRHLARLVVPLIATGALAGAAISWAGEPRQTLTGLFALTGLAAALTARLRARRGLFHSVAVLPVVWVAAAALVAASGTTSDATELWTDHPGWIALTAAALLLLPGRER